MDARYKKDYSITAEQLRHLGEEAKLLMELTKKLSQAELSGLEILSLKGEE